VVWALLHRNELRSRERSENGPPVEEAASMLGWLLFRARDEGLALTPAMDELKHLLADVAIDQFA